MILCVVISYNMFNGFIRMLITGWVCVGFPRDIKMLETFLKVPFFFPQVERRYVLFDRDTSMLPNRTPCVVLLFHLSARRKLSNPFAGFFNIKLRSKITFCSPTVFHCAMLQANTIPSSLCTLYIYVRMVSNNTLYRFVAIFPRTRLV